MGTIVLFQVPGSLFNIAQLLKYMELGQCGLSGPTASFERIYPRRSGSPKGAKPHRALPSPDRKMTEFART
jgi:hypothetical protein